MLPDADALADVVVDTIQAAIDPIVKRVDDLESSYLTDPPRGEAGPEGPQGPQGERGTDGHVGAKGMDGLSGADGLQGDPGPQGDTGGRGEPGPQGERGDAGPQGERGLDGAIGEKGLTGDAGERGEVGPEGEVGQIGMSGRDGKDVDESRVVVTVLEQVSGAIEKAVADRLTVAVTDAVTKALAAIEMPKDGRDGQDGVGLAGALLNKGGELVVTLTNGTVHTLGMVVGQKGADGRDGEPGTNGQHGLGFEDLNFASDEDGRLVIRFERGDVVKTSPPVGMTYRGVYREGVAYLKADCVSFGGSLFIAQRNTSTKPQHDVVSVDGTTDVKRDTNMDWRLSAKRGRDGRPGIPGPQGTKGMDGKPGRDLTQLDPSTGRKW